MEQQDNRNKQRGSAIRKPASPRSGKRPAPASRSKASRRPVSPTRARTASGEPMSRDEFRSAKNMERRKKQRKKQLAIYAIAIIFVVIAAIVLSIIVFFKISGIKIAGDEIYSSAEIIDASGLKNGDNMFTFNKTEVAENIEKELPYIKTVEISRSVTGEVTFTVTAAKAELAVDRGDSYILMSADCKILEDNVQAINEDIAIVKASALTSSDVGTTAVFENENDAETISRIAEVIAEKGIENITEIDVTDASNIMLCYSQRIKLDIGTVSTLEKNVDFIKASLKKIDTDDPNFAGVIDFTIENKAFINDNVTEASTKPSAEPKTDKNGEVVTEKSGAAATTKADKNNGENTTAKSSDSD